MLLAGGSRPAERCDVPIPVMGADGVGDDSVMDGSSLTTICGSNGSAASGVPQLLHLECAVACKLR